MRLVKLIAIAIILAILLLLSLPFLLLFTEGAIIGSFDEFPREDDTRHVEYAIVAVTIVIVDAFICVGLVRLVKAIRRN